MPVTVMGVEMLTSDVDTFRCPTFDLGLIFQTRVKFKLRIGLKFLLRGIEAAL